MKGAKCKDIVKLFIPPIYYKLKRKFNAEVIETQNSLLKRSGIGNKMIIIGNGPSLNITMQKNASIVCGSDCMMVNHAAVSELFEKIKPIVYVLVDPLWFDEKRKLFEDTIPQTLQTIRTKTRWKMTIVVPDSAKGSQATLMLAENPFITIEYFNNSWRLPKGTSKFEAWDKNLIPPPGQTVLNTCVWLSLYWGYKETYLIGADTSFLADERIDQETNEVYTIDTHFYNNEEVYKDANLFDKEHRRVIPTKFHEELISVATALKGYWDMREYADWKGLKVYNASEYSWIDAFERKKLQ